MGLKRKVLFVVLLLVFVGAGGVVTALSLTTVTPLRKIEAAAANTARGAYLARASGCIACHTDFENNGKPLAGGAGIKTDFGTFYAPNVTTDKAFGLGNWSLDEFALAVRQGISPKTGEPYYPAFPYTFYSQFTDQDIADLWAAFNTVPAVDSKSEEQKLRFPFSIRSGLFAWQKLFFDQSSSTPEPHELETNSRGKFLIETAGHCGACHTPRNLLGGLQKHRWFGGVSGTVGEGGGVPSITKEKLLEQGWSKRDLAYALKTGVKLDGDVLAHGMGEVIKYGTSYLNADDLDAMAAYLLD